MLEQPWQNEKAANIKPIQSNSPWIINTREFMTTAQIPYLNKVTIARDSISGQFFFNKKAASTKTKNKLAVGLSGTNIRKMGGVSFNCHPYHTYP